MHQDLASSNNEECLIYFSPERFIGVKREDSKEEISKSEELANVWSLERQDYDGLMQHKFYLANKDPMVNHKEKFTKELQKILGKVQNFIASKTATDAIQASETTTDIIQTPERTIKELINDKIGMLTFPSEQGGKTVNFDVGDFEETKKLLSKRSIKTKNHWLNWFVKCNNPGKFLILKN
uniref:Uncharacterized protein n=1 Tax=Acrobeloides nanus TaxID=290746 RepID=A0A914D169_9BILA